MKSANKIFKILFLILIIHHKTASFKILRSIRSVDGGSNSISNQINSSAICQAYSNDGDCLGDIYIEYYGVKCLLCPVKCRKGYKKDQHGKCRKIKHPQTTTTAKPIQNCYLGFLCF